MYTVPIKYCGTKGVGNFHFMSTIQNFTVLFTVTVIKKNPRSNHQEQSDKPNSTQDQESAKYSHHILLQVS